MTGTPRSATTPGEERGDLTTLTAVVRRRLWLVVAGVVVGIGAALAFAHLQSKQYQSTASLLFRPVYLDVAVTGTTLQVPGSDPTREVATNVSLVSQQNVMAAAARRLGPPYTASSLRRDVSIASIGKSDLVSVRATANSPDEAARVANTVADAYIAQAGKVIVFEISAAEHRIEALLSNGQLTSDQQSALRSAQTKLALLALLGPQNVHLSQQAIPPTRPSSPRLLLDVVLGGIGGLVVGLALAFAAEQFDHRLRSASDVERETGLPVLATIPRQRSLGESVNRPYRTLRGNEPFEHLASVLRHRPGGRDARSVLVTSLATGSGKTTVALRLALAAAGGLSVQALLVESDIRNPQVSRLAELSPATMLPGESHELEMHKLALGPNGVPYLLIVPAGPPSADGAAPLGSERMRNLLRIWAASHELIVIDGPSADRAADMIALATQVDAVLIVVRLGRDTAPGLRRLRVELDRLGVEPIGVIANFA